MAGPSDLVPPFEPPERSSQAKAVSSSLSDVERWPGTGWQLPSAPALHHSGTLHHGGALHAGTLHAGTLHAGTAPELQGRAVIGGLTAARARGHLGTAVASLGLTKWTMGSSVIMSVTGEVDIATTDQLSEALGAALHRGPKGLICDLSGVGFLGAAGLTTLLVARRRAAACHAWFDLACSQPLPRRVIALAGLDAVFSLHDHVAEAATAQARREGRPGLASAARAS